MADRSRSYVIITGAGASHNLAAGGNTFPMMKEWSDELCQALVSANVTYLQITGLEKGLDGAEFEARLGAFLRSVSSFADVKRLIQETPHLPQMPSTLTKESLAEWHVQSSHHFAQIIRVIHDSLYAAFGARRVDTAKAAAAYRSLFEALELDSEANWVYATTNYDLVAEHALYDNGYRVDDGVTHGPSFGSERKVSFEGVVSNGDPRRVPLLHLHGRVGWVRMDSGEVEVRGEDRFDPSTGTPVAVLPDPNKVYDGELVQQVWREFEVALEQARRVVVVGHSLNDAALIRALRERVDRLERIAVAVRSTGPNHGEAAPGEAGFETYVREALPGAVLLPMFFGEKLNANCTSQFKTWRDRTETLG
jgi:hypothetical protein